MIDKKTWEEFRDSGLFWWINMLLQTFGWSIIIEHKDDEIIDVYPARNEFRGFNEMTNKRGYRKVSEYMKNNADQLYEESLIGKEEY